MSRRTTPAILSAAPPARLPGPPRPRRFLALAALLALFLQSLAIQAHIHPTGPRFLAPAAAAVTNLPLPGPLKSPDFDQGTCRLCQEMAHAGAYLVPVAVLPVLSAAAIAPLPWKRAVTGHSAPAFSWQGRGPPIR